MTKSADYEHHAPRVINKSKKGRNSFNEESIVNRQSRISFKSYVRQLSEDDAEDDQETWVVERGILENVDDKFLTWNEIAACPDQDEAEEEVRTQQEIETTGKVFFRARLV